MPRGRAAGTDLACSVQKEKARASAVLPAAGVFCVNATKSKRWRILITPNCRRYTAHLPMLRRRYSPAKCIGSDMKTVSGDPDPKHVSTSYVERHNLTMRMGMRRFTRLTNGFSKKIENHIAMVAIHTVYYNFGRIHKTLRITPAMAAGLSDHVWSLEEIAGLAK
jgi:hypothetical protein